MTTTIQKIIENYILEEIFCEFPTDLNQGAFYLFLHGDMINQTDAVCDTAYGTEWGFEVCQTYELDNVRAIRGLMQSMYDDLLRLSDKLKEVKNKVNRDTFECEGCGRILPESEMSDVMEMAICNRCECLDDGIEDDDRVSCEISLNAFEIARIGKDEIYNMAKQEFAKVGLILDIEEMEMIPIMIDEQEVTYRCVSIDYNRTWSNGDISIHRDNKMITPLHESLLLLNENITSKSCNYDRSSVIKLPKSFDINSIDKRMKELKTDVVDFRDKFYIVGIYDDGYALWECEV